MPDPADGIPGVVPTPAPPGGRGDAPPSGGTQGGEASSRNPVSRIRYSGLDACRAAAMMLGIFFHGAISFLSASPPFGWAIRDRSTSVVVDVLIVVCHTFRMPV